VDEVMKEWAKKKEKNAFSFSTSGKIKDGERERGKTSEMKETSERKGEEGKP